jgi:superfamily I DNA and/or RNA helicase
MVSAPTNKAVTVLAERFLDVINSAEDGLSCKCNAVLIGVEDKLISQSSQKEANYLSTETMSSPLRSIFVYSWADSLKHECQSLLTRLKNLGEANRATNNKDTSIDTLISLAEKIKTKISTSIPSQRSVCACAKTLLQQLRAAAASVIWEHSINDFQCGVYASHLEKAFGQAKDLIEALDDMGSPVQELLATAQVIFCTLSTSGAAIFKQTRGIDDLLIDEAAASTEPEICIPFHLRPQRMLAVGDRKFILF